MGDGAQGWGGGEQVMLGVTPLGDPMGDIGGGCCGVTPWSHTVPPHSVTHGVTPQMTLGDPTGDTGGDAVE